MGSLRSYGVVIDKVTNTNIIVDKILSLAKSLTIALIYMECLYGMPIKDMSISEFIAEFKEVSYLPQMIRIRWD